MVTLQKELGLGLASECEGFLSELSISCDPSSMTKQHFKRMIKSSVHARNKEHLLEESKTYKKLDYQKLVSEEYGLKPYIRNMSVSQARVYFSSRALMLPTVQHNFKHKPEYVANQWRCVCGQPDQQAHLQTCRSYLHLQQGLDMEQDTDLVRFYQLVIKERLENEESNKS